MAKSGLPKTHRYGVDFKLRAVQMSNQPGVLIKDVAVPVHSSVHALQVAQAGARW